VRGTPNITGTAGCVRARPVPASRLAATCWGRWGPDPLSAAAPVGSVPAVDELVEPAISGE